MWPYKFRGARDTENVREKQPSRLDAHDFERNDTYIRIWLPATLVEGIDLLCLTYDSSRPDILRWIFFEHAFGRMELAHLKLKVADEAEKPVNEYFSGMFSRGGPARPEPIEVKTRRSVMHRFLGKSDLSIKLFMNSILKTRLNALAEQANQPVSDYLRAVLVRQLLGEHFYQEWQQELDEASLLASKHERPKNSEDQ